MSRLPNDSYRMDLIYKNSFNSNLISGMQQGLSLYSPDQDIKLYNYLDTRPIEKVNFNNINNELDEKGTAYNQGKQVINGLVNALNDATNDTEQNLKNFFKNIGENIKFILGAAIILIIILNRK